MSRKNKKPKAERKPKAEGKPKPDQPKLPTAEILKRRRNKRFLILGILVVLFPVFELVAYQFRAITIVVENRSSQPMTKLVVTYPGGSLDAAEIKPGGSVTRVIRPNFSFKREDFSTYRLGLSFSHPGGIYRQYPTRVGTLDYSARETYTLAIAPPEGPIEVKHSTQPGFPIGTFRDLLSGLGL